jgi:hypothetical protein
MTSTQRPTTYKYRLLSADGDDFGEATYAELVHPDQEILAGKSQCFRVVDVFPFDEEHNSPLAGLLQVEAVVGLGGQTYTLHTTDRPESGPIGSSQPAA